MPTSQIPDLRRRTAGVAARQNMAARRQFLVAVAGIDGFFAQKGGGTPESTATRAYDGGALVPEVLTSPAVPSDLTVRRPYQPLRDAPLARQLRPLAGRWNTTVSVTPTDGDLIPIAEPTVYQVRLLSVGEPEADASSGEAAELVLVFAVGAIA